MSQGPGYSKTKMGLGVTPFNRLFFWGLLCACLSLTSFVSSQRPTQTPVTPPPNEEKEIDISYKIDQSHAVLTCTVKDLGRRRIIWSRLSDPYPISVGTTRFHPHQSKYRVQKINSNANVLTIRNFQVADAGEYQCRVSGEFPLKEVISLNIQSGHDTTYFMSSNRSLVAGINQTVTLPCLVGNLNDRMVLWKDSHNDVISLRKRVYNGDNRFRVLHATKHDWHLQIEHLQKKDFGFYTCVVNSVPVLTRTVRLINNEPPRFAPILKRDAHFRKKITVTVGDTVKLTCNFHAYPPPTVSWHKRYLEGDRTKKRSLEATGNEYIIQSISASQAGDYVCIARNGEKHEGKARTRVIVEVPPTTIATTTIFEPNGPSTPHVYYEQQRNGQRRGRDIEITCFAIGLPMPSIHWTRHGQRLEDSYKYKLRSVPKGRYRQYSTLLIRALSSRDFGNYTCVGFNQIGLKNVVIEVYELKA